MKETLAGDVEHVAAIVRDLLDKVRLAGEHREFLVAMDRVHRLDVDTLDVEWFERLGDDNALFGDAQFSHFLETRTRQHECAAARPRQLFDGGDVAVIAMMMRHESDVELSGKLPRGDRWRLNFLVHAEIEISTDQEVTGFDQPARIAD